MKLCINSKHHWKICGNERSSYLIFSNVHWCSFSNGSVCLELAGSAAVRVILLQVVSIHDGAVGVKNLSVMLLWNKAVWTSYEIYCIWQKIIYIDMENDLSQIKSLRRRLLWHLSFTLLWPLTPLIVNISVITFFIHTEAGRWNTGTAELQ